MAEVVNPPPTFRLFCCEITGPEMDLLGPGNQLSMVLAIANAA
jgi:hypothetical protein